MQTGEGQERLGIGWCITGKRGEETWLILPHQSENWGQIWPCLLIGGIFNYHIVYSDWLLLTGCFLSLLSLSSLFVAKETWTRVPYWGWGLWLNFVMLKNSLGTASLFCTVCETCKDGAGTLMLKSQFFGWIVKQAYLNCFSGTKQSDPTGRLWIVRLQLRQEGVCI